MMVDGRGNLVRQAMRSTGTTQSELARISGVHQPSISQFLSGKIDVSDEQADRLLACMGYRLEVEWRVVEPEMTRSERRSWSLHCELSARLDRVSLTDWLSTVERNVRRLREGVTGQPHSHNLDRWEALIRARDLAGLKRVMTGLGRDSMEMREVSPFGGILSEEDRLAVLARVA